MISYEEIPLSQDPGRPMLNIIARADKGNKLAMGTRGVVLILYDNQKRRAHNGRARTLAFMTAPAGSLISYATSPGVTASDGSGRNGLFTSALLTYIDEPGIFIPEMFQKVRTYVREKPEGQQVPWESISLEGNFYFK